MSRFLCRLVPKEQMRDMETDRADVTESPFTVDTGHFQCETDLMRTTRERADNSEANTLLINQANLKLEWFRSYGFPESHAASFAQLVC